MGFKVCLVGLRFGGRASLTGARSCKEGRRRGEDESGECTRR